MNGKPGRLVEAPYSSTLIAVAYRWPLATSGLAVGLTTLRLTNEGSR
jgi:hypothetical protein